MVCLGNICRSPLAEGIFQSQSDKLKLGWRVDSAGTLDFHSGSRPNPSSVEVALRKGIDITHQRARQVKIADYEQFDYILTMDKEVQERMFNWAPKEHAHKVILITKYLSKYKSEIIPDPYRLAISHFEHVYDLLEDCFEGFLKEVGQ